MSTINNEASIDARTALDRADAEDAAGFAEYFAEDAVLRFGNTGEWQGREAIRDGLAASFAKHARLQHDIVNQWTIDDTTILEMQVTYTRHDGRDVTVPAVSIFSASNGEIVSYRIHVDQAPLFAD